MTVSYTGDVANGSSFGCFWKILGRWRGSVYKLIWRELIAYLFLYFTINAMYRLGLNEEQKRTFEKIKVYCSKQVDSIPMSFVLGFYVSLIVKRWWDQYWILPLPDSLALYISSALQGQDERGRLLRRTIMRYAMMAYVICLQRISFRVKKRFPTIQHLVETGLMTESEKKIFDLMDQKTKVIKFWMPVVWAGNIVNRARLEGRIQSDHMVQTIVTELSDFRRKLGRVMVFDTVSVPLVYTQVVTLAVYTYFLAALIGRQWVTPPDPSLIYPNYELDLYFPIFLSLQFIFYIGWLKVAETLINPFGEDDDDFELNWLIDRHLKVSYMVVDEMHEEHPELLKDQWWEAVVPEDLPYNIASERFRRHEPQGSTASLKVKPSESLYADLTSVKRHSVVPEEVYADYESVTDSPHPDSRKSWIQRQWSRVGSLRSTSSSSSRHHHRGGGLPLTVHNTGHRPSLYERILSRRSSKDNRHSNRYLTPNSRPGGGGGGLVKEVNNTTSNYNLMAHPNSRPRVPTPDVGKDQNPFQNNNNNNFIQEKETKILPSRAIESNPPQSHPSPNKPPHLQLHIQQPPPPVPNSPRIARANLLQSPPSSSSPSLNRKEREMPPIPGSISPAITPPPPVGHGHILSPIAENDGSPYSTSSTNRSNRSSSSNYPTTTSIFSGLGRNPSSPLPPEDHNRGDHHSGSGGSSRSMKSNGSSTSGTKRRLSATRGMIGADIASLVNPSPSSAIDELDTVLKETVFDGSINQSYILDEEEENNHEDADKDSRDYMTIAEVNEARNKFIETKDDEPQPQPPMLPQPRLFTIANTNRSGGNGHDATLNGNDSSASIPSTSSSPPDLEADDGYDEKGSYNEDEDVKEEGKENKPPDTAPRDPDPEPDLLVPITPPPLLPSLDPPSFTLRDNDTNDTILLLSPKKKRKSKDNGNKEQTSSSGSSTSRDSKNHPGVSKDCEVFV